MYKRQGCERVGIVFSLCGSLLCTPASIHASRPAAAASEVCRKTRTISHPTQSHSQFASLHNELHSLMARKNGRLLGSRPSQATHPRNNHTHNFVHSTFRYCSQVRLCSCSAALASRLANLVHRSPQSCKLTLPNRQLGCIVLSIS